VRGLVRAGRLERKGDRHTKRLMAIDILIGGLALPAARIWADHLDREIEAAKREIENAQLEAQRAATRNAMGSLGENRSAVAAELADVDRLAEQLRELEVRSQAEHGAKKK
jgi:polyhydroxyalkanoate synthesis regulator phasin